MDYKILVGKEAEPYLLKSSEFRLTNFRDYPYFARVPDSVKPKDVDRDCYFKSEKTVVVVVSLHSKIIGLGIGLPLSEFNREKEGLYARDEFKDLPRPLGEYFYIGELSVLKDHQHQGVGGHLLKLMEEKAGGLGFKQACLISLDTKKKDPMRIPGHTHVSLWSKKGYEESPIVSQIEWPSLQEDGSVKTIPHPMRAWVKELA